MVLRRDADGVVAVGQASHAWICGQLATAWGSPRFGAVVPLAEVALGAEQHDVGMARWDLQPLRNPDTGLPMSFMQMGVQRNAALWRRGPVRLVTQSRYAALLAVMHGRRLYRQHDLSAATPADAAAVRDFLEHAAQLERELTDSLRADPVTAPHAAEPVLARNHQLVWTWDLISLALLLDWAPRRLEAVPTADGGAVDVALAPAAQGGVSLDPWPFTAPSVTVRCEGRRLARGSDTDAELAAALAAAPWETVEFRLVPAQRG